MAAWFGVTSAFWLVKIDLSVVAAMSQNNVWTEDFYTKSFPS
jgi:hypothetical protein